MVSLRFFCSLFWWLKSKHICFPFFTTMIQTPRIWFPHKNKNATNQIFMKNKFQNHKYNFLKITLLLNLFRLPQPTNPQNFDTKILVGFIALWKRNDFQKYLYLPNCSISPGWLFKNWGLLKTPSFYQPQIFECWSPEIKEMSVLRIW